MFLKELRLIQNDRFAFLLVFVLPAMIMGTMYYAINSGQATNLGVGDKNPDALTIGLVDADPTNTFPGEDLSENFTAYMQQSPDMVIIIYEDEDDALNALYYDRVDAYMVLPYGFEGNITGDIPAFVEIHISSTEFMSQASVFSAFSSVVADYRLDHGWIKGEVNFQQFNEFEPEGEGIAATFGVFMIVFAVFIATAATAAQAIVGDIPLNRMLLTPATKMEAILAKVLAYFTVGMIQTQFLLVLWVVLFSIVPNGILWPLTLNAILAALSLSAAALGVFISTLCKTRLQANQSFLFLLFASFIVGTGFMDVGIVDDVYPLNLGRVMVIDNAFKGVPLSAFTNEFIIIIEFSIAMIILAWIVFAKRQTLA